MGRWGEGGKVGMEEEREGVGVKGGGEGKAGEA